MRTVVVSGSGGLVGSEAVRHYAQTSDQIVGIDNDMRAAFFGDEASTAWQTQRLQRELDNFRHVAADIRDQDAVDRLFAELGPRVDLVIHTAAQPSHDWAARDPHTDFTVNAAGTLVMLEATRRHCPDAVFVFTSTNKVYGDRPNSLPLVEQATRWELDSSHQYFEHGIDESMSIDSTMHSLFGASKVAADVMVQEYGRYFGMPTGVFRGGCLTGPAHSGTVLHGFLAYLMKCTVTQTPYQVFGYGAKQVRDNIHSTDLLAAFDAFARAPRAGAVYNVGGGRFANCSMLEAIELCQQVAGSELRWEYVDEARRGDHIWWISDMSRFRADYPDWQPTMDIAKTLQSIHDAGVERWRG